MKLQSKLLPAAVLLAGAQSAFAADLGTDAGTEIVNTATVSFEVDGIPQTVPTEGSSTFRVDRKVDVLVEISSSTTRVAPEAVQRLLEFEVTNKTNDTLDFILSYQASGEPDFDLEDVQIWVDSDGDGQLDPEEQAHRTYIDDLEEDETINVWIVANIPSSEDVTDGDESPIALIAQAADPEGDVNEPGDVLEETPGADRPDEIDNVFADTEGTVDGERDGKHSATGTYIVGSATVAVEKTMTVICEKTNEGTCAGSYSEDNFKPIPGALIQYCILVSNTGSASADNVTVEDPVDTANLDWVADSIRIRTDSNATCDSESAEDQYEEAEEEDDDELDEGDRANFVPNTDEGKGTVTATAEKIDEEGGKFAVMFRMIVK